MQDYSQEKLKELFQDNDGDGIPNDEDTLDFDEESVTDFFDKINDMTNEVSKKMDHVIRGFSC
jgi:hypothetical protein